MKGVKGDPNASFFVQVRRHERQILRDALIYADWNEEAAAKLLGLEITYLRTRSRRLGGIFPDDPPNEPYQWEYKPKNLRSKKRKPRNEKPENKLSPPRSESDDQGDPTDDVGGSAGGPDVDQGGDAGDDDQPRNGEHLQPD